MPKSPLTARPIIKPPTPQLPPPPPPPPPSPSSLYLIACEAEPRSITPDTTKNDEEKQEEETLAEDLEKPENDRTEFEDCENCRIEDELCGRKVKGLYENGWFTGTIQYFNEKMGRYRVLYDDDSEDYIGIEEIKGVKIVLPD